VLQLEPQDSRSHLPRHPALPAAGDEVAGRGALQEFVAAALGQPRSTTRLLRMLKAGGLLGHARVLLAALFERNLCDWRLALRYAAMLEDAGEGDRARAIFTRLFHSANSLGAPSLRAIINELSSSGGDGLLYGAAQA